MRARCPSCAKEYTVPESALGKSVKCRACGKVFAVPAVGDAKTAPAKPPAIPPARKTQLAVDPFEEMDETPPPRRATPAEEREAVQAKPDRRRASPEDDEDEGPRRGRRRRHEEEEDDDRPRRRRTPLKKGRSNKLGYIMAGASGGLFLLGMVLYMTLMMRVAMAAQRNMAGMNPQFRPPFPGNPNPFNPNQNPFNPNPVPNQNFRPAPNPAPAPAPVKKALAPWNAQPDPGPKLAEGPPKALAKFSVPFSHDLVFSSTPSVFLGMKDTRDFRQPRFVVTNLLTGEEKSTPGRLELNNVVLSPDGQFFAGGKHKPGGYEIQVWSLQEKRAIMTTALDTPLVQLVDFLADNKLLAASLSKAGGSNVNVFDIKSGQQTSSYASPSGRTWQAKQVAFSPGRKYVAQNEQGIIQLSNAADGTLLGQLQLPEGNFVFNPPMAFSPDGAEFACLYEASGISHIASWTMKDGNLAKHHRLEKNLSAVIRNTFSRRHGLEWLPDRSGWLCYGEMLLDYATGTPILTLSEGDNSSTPPDHWLLGKDHYVKVSHAKHPGTAEVLPLPLNDLAAARKDAAGGKPAELALKQADLSTVRVLPPAKGSLTWKVKDIDASAKPTTNSQSVKLEGKPSDVMGVVFARPDKGRAAVIETFSRNPLAKIKSVRVERLDLVSGSVLNTVSLTGSETEATAQNLLQNLMRADLSPEGNRLALRTEKQPQRVDLWDLDKGQRLYSFQPYAKDGATVEWLGFIDDNRLLTLGSQGKLVLWELADCKAVYSLDGYRAPLDFSPGRDFAIAFNGSSFEIVFTSTGERLGQLAAIGNAASMMGGGFRADGKGVAASYITSAGQTEIAVWNMADGSLFGKMPYQGMRKVEPLVWAGTTHILRGNYLVDLNLKGELVHYGGVSTNFTAHGSPDGRLWFVGQSGAASLLKNAVVPEATAQALAAAVAAGKVEDLMPPGTRIEVKVNTTIEKVREAATNQLPRSLEQRGYAVGPGGLTLTINATESATGKTLDYEITKFGPGAPIPRFGKGQIVKITEKQITCSVTLTDTKGTQLFATSTSSRTPGSIQFKGENYQAELDASMIQNITGFAGSVGLPKNFYRIDGRIQSLPMFVRLPETGDGMQPPPRNIRRTRKGG